MITAEAHPCLDLHTFVTVFPRPLGEMVSTPELLALLSIGEHELVTAKDPVRAAVRDLLRHGGFKPTGRSKPAAEYLLRAAQAGSLGSIDVAVDACNAVSLHTALPISVVDLDRAAAPLRVGVAPAGASYVFNQSGQTMDLGGLLCLFDAEGPCANAVKDAQRTKTRPETVRTLSLIWGTSEAPGAAAEAAASYRELLERHGATIESIWP